jgi:hypothetical protein
VGRRGGAARRRPLPVRGCGPAAPPAGSKRLTVAAADGATPVDRDTTPGQPFLPSDMSAASSRPQPPLASVPRRPLHQIRWRNPSSTVVPAPTSAACGVHVRVHVEPPPPRSCLLRPVVFMFVFTSGQLHSSTSGLHEEPSNPWWSRIRQGAHRSAMRGSAMPSCCFPVNSGIHRLPCS